MGVIEPVGEVGLRSPPLPLLEWLSQGLKNKSSNSSSKVKYSTEGLISGESMESVVNKGSKELSGGLGNSSRNSLIVIKSSL